ncbi:hypothetical protein FKM82_015844 [Ascaphus truei]
MPEKNILRSFFSLVIVNLPFLLGALYIYRVFALSLMRLFRNFFDYCFCAYISCCFKPFAAGKTALHNNSYVLLTSVRANRENIV